MLPTLMQPLLRGAAYPHPAEPVELLETHISWVLLAGEFAYKIKKPLALGFLDFRALERRQFFCAEELRLNRHWAPALYLDVVCVTRCDDGVRIGGAGEIVDYAVRMRRFEQAAVLAAQLDAGLVTPADLRDLAARLARWHATAPRPPATQRDDILSAVAALIDDNYTPLARALCPSDSAHPTPAGRAPATDREQATAAADDDVLQTLRAWTSAQLGMLAPVIAGRFDRGRFCDCHGDLHLGNLVRLADGITPFDCIEFDPLLRCSDVMADVAFLGMDLTVRERTDLAAQFLNRYLECSGDYDGVRVYTLYVVYRCLVRAKIAALRSASGDSGDSGNGGGAARANRDAARRYLAVALQHTLPRQPLLIAMHGLSGAGKSFVADKLMLHLPALRLRSDLERKRMHGLDETARSASRVGGDLYSADATHKLYARLGTLARTLLRAGHDVIVDASFLARAARDDVRAMARRSAARFVLCDVVAEPRVLQQRIAARQARGDDPSEADAAVLEHQMATQEPLQPDEQAHVVRCASDDAATALIARLRARAG